MGDLIAKIQANWVQIGIIALASLALLKAIRDAIDTTPQSDDNFFEKTVSLLSKIIVYLFGKNIPNK